MTPGTRVSFPARRGELDVTLTGTVMPSRFRTFAHVQVDGGPLAEVDLRNVTLIPVTP